LSEIEKESFVRLLCTYWEDLLNETDGENIRRLESCDLNAVNSPASQLGIVAPKG